MKQHIIRQVALSLATRRLTFFRSLALAAPGAAILALASPALASTGTRGRGAASRDRLALHSNIAGWLDGNVQGGFTMSATLVLPRLRCGSARQAIDPNVGGAEGPPAWAGEFVGCYKGKAHYFPWLVENGRNIQPSRLAAHAGDTIVLRVSVISTKTAVSVVDKTTKGASKKVTGPGARTGGGHCWADDNPVIYAPTGRLEGVPNFGKLTFSHTVLDGRPLGTASPLAEYNRYRGRTLQIKTSPFASNQETFKTVFKHS